MRSCLTASVTQPSPNDSHAGTVTGRAPSIVHIAISTAPVSDAGTMPMRCVSGTCSTARVSRIASDRRALPIVLRCERPRLSRLRAEGFQPGRLAQGPLEKCGRAGRTFGMFVNGLSSQRARAALGRRGPPPPIETCRGGSSALSAGEVHEVHGAMGVSAMRFDERGERLWRRCPQAVPKRGTIRMRKSGPCVVTMVVPFCQFAVRGQRARSRIRNGSVTR